MEAGAGIRQRSSYARDAASAVSDLAIPLLAAVITTILLQTTRVFLSYMVFIVDQAERVQLGLTAGGVYLAIGLGALIPSLLGLRRSVLALTVGLVAARIALQFWSNPDARMWLAASVIVMAGWMLPVLLVWSRADAAFGVAAGLALDLAIRAGRDSVDLAFIPGFGAHTLTVILALLALLAAGSFPAVGPDAPRSGWAISALALGPALALHHLATGNLGIAQVQLESRFGAGAWLLAGGMVAGFGLVILQERLPVHSGKLDRLFIACVAALGALGLFAFYQDWPGLAGAGLLIGGTACTTLTVSALRGSDGQAGVAATASWLTAGMLVQAAVLFIYFSATGLPLLVATLFGLLALVALVTARQTDHEPNLAPRTLAGLGGIAAILLMTTLIVSLRADEPGPSSPLPATFTVMTYNIQSGFSRGNVWDLEATARVIEAESPDVVILQEVGRGWPILAAVDQARWLSHRLDMQLVWGPASHDELWGNAILTRAPILESHFINYGTTENLRRGAVRAVVASENGPVTLIATHLDNPGDAESARQAQVAQLLALWDNAALAVIGGDFNAEPSSAAIQTITTAGLVDAGAILGPEASTSEAGRRIDYILATPDLEVIESSIPDTWASDHRPFVTRLQVGS